MKMPIKPNDLLFIHRELINKNNLKEGLIYLQISRGKADRDFEYPNKNVKQTLKKNKKYLKKNLSYLNA